MPRRSDVEALGPILIVFAGLALLRNSFISYTQLPEKAYFEPVIALEFLKRPLAVAMVVGAAAFFIVFREKLSWGSFEHGKLLRFFFFTVAAVLAWAFSAYDFNLYFGEAHWVDRALVVVLALAVLAHPAFVFPFLLVTMAVVGQFAHPLGRYSWTDKRPLFDVLIAFTMFLGVKPFLRVRSEHVLFMVLVFVGGAYAWAGASKVLLGPHPLTWVFDNELHNLVVFTYQAGWLGFIAEDTILDFASLLGKFNVPMQAATIVIELAGILMLLRRKLTIGLVFVSVGLHLVIYLTSGIFFWKWIILNFALIAVLYMWRERTQILFQPRYALVGAVLMVLAPFYTERNALGWFYSDISQRFQIEAVGASGDAYTVGPTFLSPYEVPFGQSRFSYLSHRPSIAGNYGSVGTNYQRLQSISRVNDVAGARAVIAAEGSVNFDPEMAREFDRFMRIYFSALNRRGSKDVWLSRLSVPPHIESSPDNAYHLQEPVDQIRVRLIETYYDSDTPETISNQVIREIDIP